MKAELAPIAPRLEGVLRSLPPELRHQLSLGAGWERAVGSEIAAHATPAGITGTTLHVRADSEAWARTLRRLSARLIAALEASAAVRLDRIEVRVVARRPAMRGTGPTAAPTRAVPLPARWAGVLEGVEDAKVRDALRGMLQAYADAHLAR